VISQLGWRVELLAWVDCIAGCDTRLFGTERSRSISTPDTIPEATVVITFELGGLAFSLGRTIMTTLNCGFLRPAVHLPWAVGTAHADDGQRQGL